MSRTPCSPSSWSGRSAGKQSLCQQRCTGPWSSPTCQGARLRPGRQKEVSAALDPLSSSSLQRKLAHAFGAAAVARPLVGALASAERTVMVGSGTLGPGAQQVVPVRFPEAQHQRLKDWCTTHGFSMAVVLRGLVERFLDDQERRAA